MNTLPLEGVRVLDLTRLLPGAYATLILSGFGADVIKVEEPGAGDGLRMAPPWTESGESGPHAVLNRGKRSASIDLKARSGRDLMLRLVERSDVLMDSFRPGVLDRLALGSADLREANPGLVHVTIDAFGSGGPYERLPAHDLNSAGFAGIVGLARDADGVAMMPSVPVVDHLAGLNAVIAVMVGLRQKDGPSSGYRAEVAMSDSAASLLTLLGGFHAATGASPPAPETLSGMLACYDLYECADGKSITVGALEPKFFGRMLDLMGRTDLKPLQYDIARQQELRAGLSEAFRAHDRAHWVDLLASEDTCVGPVNDVGEALADPNLRARGLVTGISFRDGARAPAVRAVPWLPWERAESEAGQEVLSAPDASTRRPAPGLGEHTAEVLREFGIATDDIDRLRAAGVTGAQDTVGP